ncbi:MAG: 2-amino-4-hydroxy-6-hydroxymethyldihydropteridine diphosphokinase [Betaproteobacteria bacterium]|nr:2-amino-4-hydroxy-6-hydroxymethyldihydropteridine diphosphokinase [Betaproteobacteria bacterium]
MKQVEALVALGANLGDPVRTVSAALQALAEIPATTVAKVSSLYRTAPVGLKNQPDFINAVALLHTALPPQFLLEELFHIEGRFGRLRSISNAPRTLDLDLLLHGESIMTTAELTLPHPRMHQRAFVLIPLLEVVADCRIPGHGLASKLLEDCSDQRVARIHDKATNAA